MASDPNTASSSWWGRTCGGREVLIVALPLVMSSLSWTLLTFIDRILLTWWSQDALAASFPASLMWWMSMCLPLGVCMYASTFVSQYFGAGRPLRIGPSVWQGVWVAVFSMPLIAVSTLLAPVLFRAAGHGESVLAAEIEYFQLLSYGSGGMLISYALSSFYSGRSQTYVVMYVDGFSAALNAALDYCWIFGHCGFAAGGIRGAAWATVTALWIKTAIYLALMLQRRHRRTYRTGRWRLRPALFGRLLYFGVPSGLQMFLEVAGFTAFVFLVGGLGATELAATNLAFNVSSLAFMPVFGLALTASILVGQQLGNGQPDMAARATWTTAWIALAYIGTVSLFYVATPELFLFGFFAYADGEQSDAIRQLSVLLLRYVAAYNLFDALNLVFAHAIKGAGDTVYVFLISLVMAVALSAGSWIGVRYFRLQLHGSWALLTIWITLLGCLYLGRFLQGRWRTMRVIEA